MGKQEFIDKLRAALDGRIAPAQVAEHVNYYTDYINNQIRMGKSEEEVLKSLGNPRLIAKSIIDASGQKNAYSGGNQSSGYRNTSYSGTSYHDASYHDTSYQGQTMYQQNNRQNEEESRGFKMPGWLRNIGIIMLIILGLGLVFSVLSFLAPLIFVMAVVIFLVKLFRDWLN